MAEVGIEAPEFYQVPRSGEPVAKVIEELFVADSFLCDHLSHERYHRQAHDLIDHSSEHEHLEVILITLAIERFVEVGRLLPGAEDDLDVPTAAVKFADVPGSELLGGDVGRDEMPLAAQALGFAQGATLGFFMGFAEGFFGNGFAGTNRDKPCLMLLFAKGDVEIEKVFDGGSIFVTDDEIGSDAAEPVGSLALDEHKFSEDEIATISQDEISFTHQINEVFPKIPVLFGRSMKAKKNGMPVQKVNGEVDLHACSDALTIAVGREVGVVRFGEFLLGGVLDEDAIEEAFETRNLRGAALPLFQQVRLRASSMKATAILFVRFQTACLERERGSDFFKPIAN